MPPIHIRSGTDCDIEIGHAIRGVVRSVRAVDGKSVRLGGHAALYNQRSEWLGWFFEEIAPGAFRRALNGEDDVRFLIDHDSGRVLGRSKSGTLRLGDDGAGLTFEVDLPDTQEARDLTVLVERGDVTQMSFGFRTVKDAWRVERRADGSSYEVRTLEDVSLFDVSAVAFPAYPQTDIAKRRLAEFRSAKALPPARTRSAAASLRLADAALRARSSRDGAPDTKPRQA